MLCQLGSIVTSVSGRLGGSEFLSQSGSTIMRNRTPRTRKINALNTATKRYYSMVAIKWRQLSVANKAKWLTFAIAFSQHFSKNSNTNISAFHAFFVCGVYKYLIGNTPALTPQKFVAHPTPNFNRFSCVASGQTVQYILNKQMSSGSVFLIAATRALPKSISSHPNAFKIIGYYAYVTGLTRNITTQYKAVFPWSFYAGQVVFFKITVVDGLSGIPSSPIIVKSIVT